MTAVSILELSLKPDALEEAPAVVSGVLEATRGFIGNLGVEVVIDHMDPTHWSVIERWESIEADDGYRAFRRSPEGASTLSTLLAAAPVLTRYTVSDV